MSFTCASHFFTNTLDSEPQNGRLDTHFDAMRLDIGEDRIAIEVRQRMGFTGTQYLILTAVGTEANTTLSTVGNTDHIYFAGCTMVVSH